MTIYLLHGETQEEIRNHLFEQYGENVKITGFKKTRIGTGFLGLVKKDGFEASYYFLSDDEIKNERLKKKQEEENRNKFNEDKQKLLEQAALRRNEQNTQLLETLLQEMQTVKKTVEGQSSGGEKLHPLLEKIDNMLIDNDFSKDYRNTLLEKIRSEFSISELDNDEEKVEQSVVEWIGDNIKIYNNRDLYPRPHVIIIVGPTGVGKTTTIAKLAAIHRLGRKGIRKQSVRIITIDQYRIGAVEQINTFARILEIPASCADSPRELKSMIAENQDVDLILIDTIGKSPKDPVELAKMQKILEVSGKNAEVFLAISATTKTQDMLDILRQFEPFLYRSVIVTKLDETSCAGSIISALAHLEKSVAWITDGQNVPNDIKFAHPLSFLTKLESFSINIPKLEERYGTYFRDDD